MITFIAWGTPIMGGVQNLILNISQELNVKNQKAKIFGFKNCLIIKELYRLKVDFEFHDFELIKPNDLSNYLTNEDIIVFCSYSPRFKLFLFKDANPRILYWNVFANKLSIANKAKFINFKSKTKRLIKELVKHNSLVFMDIEGIKSIEKEIGYGLLNKDEDIYLPIPVKSHSNTNAFLENSRNTLKKINITYVGRSSVWKMQPLKKIIKDLANITLDDYVIHIHIISQQPKEYSKFIENVKIPDFIKIHYHDDLIGEKYRIFLANTSDLHFAMGTAALDGGILGIPTIVVDYSVKDFPEDYQYIWLYDSKGYDLGHPVEKINHPKSMKIEYLISLYRNSEQIHEISENTFKYVYKNHEISMVTDKLLTFVSKADLRVKSVLKYTLINKRIIKFALRIIGRDVMKIYK